MRVKLTQKKLFDQLKEVLDPELGISIADLGLVYDIKQVAKDRIEVLMTLTSMGCPLFELMEKPIKEQLAKLPGIKSIKVNLTFDPPWTPDKMSKDAKVKLGFF